MNTFLITLLAFMLSCLVSLILCCCGLIKEENFEERFVVIVLTCMILAIITGLTLDIKSWKSDYVHTKTATEQIVSLKDNPGIESYYARRTYIESKLYYNYMVELSDGYIANQVPANKTYIYETNGAYRVEWWKKEKGYLFMKRTENYWKIYIPKDSIVSEYEIDLQ